MTTPPFDFRPEDRSLVIRGETVSLTPREVEVISHLVARLDVVVTRTELEREVFGFRAGTRSETVPVTVRRVRAKLGAVMESLETIRGVGWRLRSVAQRLSTEAPRFMTPYHSRPADEAAVRGLLLAGWRVVTVVGPGGSGKTRLVAEIARSMDEEVAFAAVGAATDEADVARMLADAVGVHDVGVASILAGLEVRDVLLVVDEAEVAFDHVVAVLRRLPDARMLVTSRRTLGLEGEAVHAISRLEGDDAVVFLRSRLAASQWGRPAHDAVVGRAVVALDGLPLALELVAAHPDPLEVSVEDLEAGVGLSGSQGGRLQESIARSFVRLNESSRRVLLAMSLCEGTLSDEDLCEWLGPDAASAAHDLASRSLVVRQGTGWAVLRTMRSYARAQATDWSALEASWDTWLVRTAEALLAQLRRDPRRAKRRGARLLTDLMRAVDRIDVEHLARFIYAMHRFLIFVGPASSAYPMLLRAAVRAPNDLRVAVLSIPGQGSSMRATLDAADASPDPMCRFYSAVVRHLAVAGRGDAAGLHELIPDLPCPGDRLLAHRISATWLLAEDPELGLSRLRSVVADSRGMPVLAVLCDRSLAIALAGLGHSEEALAIASRAARCAESTGLVPLGLYGAEVYAVVLGEVDSEAGVLANQRAAERWRLLGSPPQARAARAVAGILLASTWQASRAGVELELALDGDITANAFASYASVCKVLLLWVAGRGGDRAAARALGAAPGAVFDRLSRVEGTGAGMVELLVGDVEISQASPDRRAGMLRRLLEKQEVDHEARQHPILRNMLAGMRQRLEALERTSR